MRHHTRLVTGPIDIPAVTAQIAGGRDGAVALFIGQVRDHHHGRDVAYLEYHAYSAMASEEMERIAGEMSARFDIDRMALVHRTGRLEVGDVSVLIAVSGVHRAPALDCCAAAIEEIKRRVPIWKKEFFTDGTATWVFGPDGRCTPDRERHG
ncbi:MAG: molybdenum cofactor biosynthesis protein MoaE [Acidobacteriota bacterium]